MIYDGGSRSDAAWVGGVGLQIVRDWVMRFNTAGPAGLIDRKAPGPSRWLKPAQRQALSAMVESAPDPAVHASRVHHSETGSKYASEICRTLLAANSMVG